MNRTKVLEAYISLANIVSKLDPGDSDTTPEQISAAMHRVILLAEQIKEMTGIHRTMKG